jgi:VanZ family protein
MKKRRLSYFAWAALSAIIFATVSPIELRPIDLLPVDVDRALAFALLAATFTMAYPRRWATIAVILVAGAFIIELLQEFSPSRHARIDDAVVKAIGAAAGALLTKVTAILLANYHRGANQRKRHGSVNPPTKSFGTLLNVESRLIESVFFDPSDGRLRIRFRDGVERLFADVPEQEAFAIALSESPGRYYVDRIKPNFRRVAA